ncbi:pantetheine-phosphate adenylyltransferase [Hyphomicrobiales bacterium]|jgi:pantetheine-phosphate adenylyltransferase|nr:pantetheine-phosphate adenylyltransferase [Rhodobiaceae bacterium]MDB4127965.1 pantetheine-phosphate adenylyltransferase [Hyphomicrobiales bacterium]MBT5641404.1 pantetheine-phosphate adenylyltransferase [Rhodobiaceae bacterium]MBT6222993.1 pantetheine-phosphate adenylyltransferase [Rhodobiaceae bacterium]MDC0139663.1 pantetheine-phosphate adenylyltransferase [Hyphomicrobiales bacterium]|tara:strand:- start:4339 stop:4824 length:486 start_codon:yes stop_codon:yes gene_type:complete
MGKSVFFPGTFDPITFGHLDIIKNAISIFDRLIIGIGEHHDKSSLINVENRLSLIKESLNDYQVKLDNIDIIIFNGLLVDVLEKNKCNVIIRGVRDAADLNYELKLSHTNSMLSNDIKTIFMPTNNEYSYISSTIVKQIHNLGGDISQFVPKNVITFLNDV